MVIEGAVRHADRHVGVVTTRDVSSQEVNTVVPDCRRDVGESRVTGAEIESAAAVLYI